MKYLGTHEIEGINSKDCFKALKVRLHEIVQKEIETALETHNLDMMQSRNFSSAYGLIDNESLWYRHKGIYFADSRLIVVKQRSKKRISQKNMRL